MRRRYSSTYSRVIVQSPMRAARTSSLSSTLAVSFFEQPNAASDDNTTMRSTTRMRIIPERTSTSDQVVATASLELGDDLLDVLHAMAPAHQNRVARVSYYQPLHADQSDHAARGHNCIVLRVDHHVIADSHITGGVARRRFPHELPAPHVVPCEVGAHH